MSFTRVFRAAALAAALGLFAPGVRAQDGMGGGLMPGFGNGPSEGGKAPPKPKKNPDEPELHAAPGASPPFPTTPSR